MASPNLDEFLAEHPEWSVEDGTLCRTFTTDEYFEALDLAQRFAFHAEEVDHHPDLHVGFKKLTVRLFTHDASAITDKDTEFAAWVDDYLRIAKMVAMMQRSTKPAETIAAIAGEALERLEAEIAGMSDEDLQAAAAQDANRTKFDLGLRTPVALAFGTLQWARGVLQKPITESGMSQRHVEALTSPAEVRPLVARLKEDFAATCATLGVGEMNARTYLTPLGKAYDVETALGQAVMTLERGRHTLRD